MFKRTSALSFFLLLVTAHINAADNQTIGDLASLQGVKSFNVVIESLNNDVIQDGLSVDELQRDVELRLRKAGLPIATKPAANQPFLYVRISTIKVNGQGEYSFCADLLFQQPVALLNNPKKKYYGCTWETGSIGFASENNVQAIRHYVADDVDRFINQYLIANPVRRSRSSRAKI